MRKSKTTLISAIAIGLLAGSSVGVAAQDESADLMSPAYVTGTWSVECRSQPETSVTTDGVQELRDPRRTCANIRSDDPRLAAGEGRAISSIDIHSETPGDTVIIGRGPYEIANEGGSWTGTAIGLNAGNGQGDFIQTEVIILTGSGDYEGLTAYLIVDHTLGSRFEGIIFAGELPPLAELPVD